VATITAADMLEQGKLMTLDSLRESLSQIEPLNDHTFPTHSNIEFEVGENWGQVSLDQPTNVFLTTGGGTRYQLTRQAAEEAGAYAKMPRGLSPWMAPDIYQDFLNWAYRTGLGDKEYKLLSHDRDDAPPLALAMCRGTISQFSNLALLDAAEAGIREAYGSADILVDSGGVKYHNGLERTNMRLIVPEQARSVARTRVLDDSWSAGIAVANSLIGVSHPGTSVSGYLFRWWCTNGCTDTLASGGRLSRRTITSAEDAYAWARQSVDEILGGLEGTFDAIQNLADVPVGGSDGENVRVSQVMRDLFAQNSIPVREQNRIMAQMAELGGDLSMYDVQQAITFAANDDSISPRTADRLLELGGHVAHALHDRCGTCHQILPDDFVAMVAQAAEGNSN